MFKVFLSVVCFSYVYANSIGIIYNSQFQGEHSLAIRISEAASKLKWNPKLIPISNLDQHSSDEMDFMISVNHHPGFKFNRPDYLFFFGFCPKHWLKKSAHNSNVNILFPSILEHTGFLVVPFVENHNDFFVKKYIANGRKPFCEFYPSCLDLGYSKVVPSSIFYVPGIWGNRFGDSKFQKLNQLLDKSSFIKIYGSKKFQNLFKKNYQYPIPRELGKFEEEIQNNGICLVIHSDKHLKVGAPTSRIFEALAACSVIISDRHPFVEKYFSDCVYFIDTSLSADKIYKQIEAHYMYIMRHQEEALEKAQKGYEIFKEKFTLEKQLLNLDLFHLENLKQFGS
jgi:spore maturation protein CgeB